MAHYIGSNLSQIIRQQNADKALRNKAIGSHILQRASELPPRASAPATTAKPSAKPSLRRASGSRMQVIGGKARKLLNNARKYSNKASAQISKSARDFKAAAAPAVRKAAAKAGSAAHKAIVKGSVKAVTSMGFGHPGHFQTYHDKQNKRTSKELDRLRDMSQDTQSGPFVIYENADEGLGEVIKSGWRGYQNARLQQMSAYQRGARTHRPGLVGIGQGIANRATAVGGGLKRAWQFTTDATDQYGNNVRDVSRTAWNKELSDKNDAIMNSQRIRDYAKQLKAQNLQLTNPKAYQRMQQKQDLANAKQQFANKQHADKMSQIAQGTYKSGFDRSIEKAKGTLTKLDNYRQFWHDRKLTGLQRKTDLLDAKNNLAASSSVSSGNSAKIAKLQNKTALINAKANLKAAKAGYRGNGRGYAPRPTPYRSMFPEDMQTDECYCDYLCRKYLGVDLNEELYGRSDEWLAPALAAGAIALGGAGCSNNTPNKQATTQQDSTQTDNGNKDETPPSEPSDNTEGSWLGNRWKDIKRGGRSSTMFDNNKWINKRKKGTF